MSEQQPEGLSKEQFSSLLFFEGIFFAMIGAFSISSPKTIAEFIGIDLESAKYLALGFLVTGVTSIIISKTIFKPDNRK